MKITTACDEFLAYKRLGGCGKLTLKSYKTDILMFEAHVVHAVGPRAGITHFTTAHVLTWFEHLQSRDLTRKTLACHQTALREFAKWGLRRRYWREDPMLDVPVVAYPKTLPRPFSPEERNALMALPLVRADGTPDLAERALRAVLYHTGFRDAGVCAIRLRDVQGPETLADGRAIPARVRTMGKGNKEIVKALHPNAWAAIEVYVESRAREDRVPEAPLFAQRDGSPWKPRTIQQRVAKWGKAAGVSPCVPHRFRHTFATNLLEATNDVRLVQEALDHASLATTQIYTQVVNARLEEAMTRLTPYEHPAPETLRADYREATAPVQAPPESPIT